MFDNLMAEIEYLKAAGRVPGILEGIMFIQQYEDEYSSEVRRELREFMRQGARLFAPVPEADQYGDNALAEEF